MSAGTEGYGAGTLYDFTWTVVPGTAGIVAINGLNQMSAAAVAPSTVSLATYATPGTDQKPKFMPYCRRSKAAARQKRLCIGC